MVVIRKEEYESNILKAKDLAEDINEAIIKGAGWKTLQTGRSMVVQFDEIEKELPLNVTNLRKMIEMFGADTDSWIGKKINLIIARVSNPKGEIVDSIRIYPLK